MSDSSVDAALAPARPLTDPHLLLPLGRLTLYVIGGSTCLGIRFALASHPPSLGAGIRFLGAGIALYGFLRWRGMAAPALPQWRNAAFTGLLLDRGNGLRCFAAERVSSDIAAVAVPSTPLFAALFTDLYGQLRLCEPTGRRTARHPARR